MVAIAVQTQKVSYGELNQWKKLVMMESTHFPLGSSLFRSLHDAPIFMPLF